MTAFRHKCSDVDKTEDMEAWRTNVRKLYDVPEDAWRPLHDTPHDLARLGVLVENGRQVAFVICPDCGADVTVTREKP